MYFAQNIAVTTAAPSRVCSPFWDRLCEDGYEVSAVLPYSFRTHRVSLFNSGSLFSLQNNTNRQPQIWNPCNFPFLRPLISTSTPPYTLPISPAAATCANLSQQSHVLLALQRGSRPALGHRLAPTLTPSSNVPQAPSAARLNLSAIEIFPQL
jgi:hypothetical protein